VTDLKFKGEANTLFLEDLEYSVEAHDLVKSTVATLVSNKADIMDEVIASCRSLHDHVVPLVAWDGINVAEHDDFLFDVALLKYMYRWLQQKAARFTRDDDHICSPTKRRPLVRHAKYMIVCFLHLRLRIWEKLTRLPLQSMWAACLEKTREETLNLLDSWLRDALVKRAGDKFAFFRVDKDKLTVSIPGNKWRKIIERKQEFLNIVYRDKSVSYSLSFENALLNLQYFDDFVTVVSIVNPDTKRPRKMNIEDIASMQNAIDTFRQHFLACCSKTDVTIYLHMLF
jgi:hypothetical protein